MSGKWEVREVTLTLQGFALPMGLVVDEARVDGAGVVVDEEPFRMHLGEGSIATVRVSLASIERFLQTQNLGGLRDVAVSEEGGMLKVSGTAVVIVPIRASALCSLEVEDETKVSIALRSIDPAAGRAIVEKQLKETNPIIDLSGLSMNLAIESVAIGPDGVLMTGRAR